MCGEIVIGIMPFLDFFKSEVRTVYPMKINFIGDLNSTLNLNVNFFSQALGLFHWSFTFYTIIFIFFVILINLVCEVKIIADLCRMVGDSVGKSEAIKNKKGIQLSVAVLSKIVADSNSLPLRYKEKKLKTNCDKISKLLKTILKYHSNVVT